MIFGSGIFSALLVIQSAPESTAMRPEAVKKALIDVEQVVRDHVNSFHRKADVAAIGVINRSELVWDTFSGFSGVSDVMAILQATQLPYYLIAGETVMDTAKVEIEQRMGDNLGAVVARTLPVSDVELETLSASDLEHRFQVKDKLLAAAKQEGLVGPEVDALTQAWSRAVQGDLRITMSQVRKNTGTLREVAKSQRALDGAIVDLNSRLEKVAESVDILSRSVTEAERRDARWLTQAWDRGSFGERVAIARACDRATNADASCGNIDDDERKRMMLRGNVHDAAQSVGVAVDLYARGAAQIAGNLGVPMPKWTGTAITGISAASSLAAGVAAGNPVQIMNGLVGLTSMFKKARPSPEQMILSKLEQIDKRLEMMSRLLERIDKKLDEILRAQAEILASLNRIEQELQEQRMLAEQTIKYIDFLYYKSGGRCYVMFAQPEAVGLWSHFFKHRLLQPGAILSAQNLKDAAGCLTFIRESFNRNAQNSEMPFGAQSATGTGSDAITRNELLARASLDRLDLLLGADVGLLQPVLLAEAPSRTDLILRLANRQHLTWNRTDGNREVRASVKKLDLWRLLVMVSRTVMFLRENSKDLPLCEALASLEKFLARVILQQQLFETDLALAVFAVRVSEGGVPPDRLSVALRQELDRLSFGNDPQLDSLLAGHFLGDLLDAELFRASGAAMPFVERKQALELAWTSGSADTVNILLETASEGSSTNAAPAARMFEAIEQADSNVLLCLRAKDNVEFVSLKNHTCFSLEMYLSRARLETPNEVQVARFWLRALDASRLRYADPATVAACTQ